MAAANKIIGDSLHNNEDGLRYLFVNGLEHTSNKVIYVPTKANLPILEATRKVGTTQWHSLQLNRRSSARGPRVTDVASDSRSPRY